MKKLIFILLLFVGTSLNIRAQDQIIINGSYGINGGSYITFPVWVNDYGTIRGWFRVVNKDIECLVLDEQSYRLFNNGYDAFAVYNSGRISNARLNIRIRSNYNQWYYIVFNNKYGWTSKTIEGSIVFNQY